MNASPLARSLGIPAAAALALLVPVGASFGAAETGTFTFSDQASDTLDLTATCLGTTGTLTGTEVVAGRFTENGPPAFGFHDHYTSTLDYRIDLADGRYVVGTSVEHADDNAIDLDHQENTDTYTSLEQFKSSVAGHDDAALYSATGQRLGTVTVHHEGHMIWRDTNLNHQPDPGEIRSEIDRYTVRCR